MRFAKQRHGRGYWLEEANSAEASPRKHVGRQAHALGFCQKGRHYRNTHKGQRALDNVFKELLNDEWIIILLKKTGKGTDEHVSLNPRKVSEIKQFLENLAV